MVLPCICLLIFESSGIFTKMAMIHTEVEESFHEEMIEKFKFLEKKRLTCDLMTAVVAKQEERGTEI